MVATVRIGSSYTCHAVAIVADHRVVTRKIPVDTLRRTVPVPAGAAVGGRKKTKVVLAVGIVTAQQQMSRIQGVGYDWRIGNLVSALGGLGWRQHTWRGRALGHLRTGTGRGVGGSVRLGHRESGRGENSQNSNCMTDGLHIEPPVAQGKHPVEAKSGTDGADPNFLSSEEMNCPRGTRLAATDFIRKSYGMSMGNRRLSPIPDVSQVGLPV